MFEINGFQTTFANHTIYHTVHGSNGGGGLVERMSNISSQTAATDEIPMRDWVGGAAWPTLVQPSSPITEVGRTPHPLFAQH